MSAPLDPDRVVEFVEAAARSALADTVAQTGALLAQAIAGVTGADAVIIYSASRPDVLATLATWPLGLTPGPLAVAMEAATQRVPGEIVDALHSIVTLPLDGATESFGALVLAWRQPCMVLAPERRLLGAIAHACAAALLQLQRAEQAQLRLANLHDELAAVIAHDMRTPIAAILLQVEALLERAKLEDHVTVPTIALARMHHAGQRISRLAGDLLDVSRIELGRVALDRRELALRDAIDDLVAQLETAFPTRAITIVEDGQVPTVLVDPMRFDQIVTNLLENAAKYSTPGRPILVRIAGDGPGATVSVEDEGPVIPAADIPRLFDRFFQTRAARARKSGLGLGLYIAKGLVEAHGGRIWVDSLERGNQFHVWLPCACEVQRA
jgi:signal transduction histidine kinase